MKIDINEINLNDENPRNITDDKFNKLVKSIREFPEMLEIRPIVVDENMTVLGGNMRLKACKAAGLKEVEIYKVEQLTEEQKKEFVIKDNASYGEWDLDVLKDWSKDLLTSSGFDKWETFDIFGDYEFEDRFTGNVEGSNFIEEITDVNQYIKQNIFFFNELMIEFEDDEIKEAIRNIKDDGAFIADLKKIIIQNG
jgi:hypothetical protein